MELGIFARTFPRPTLEQTLDQIADRGITHVQFNMSCAGSPTLPDRVDEDLCIWIARCFRERGLTMAAISGTFNVIDPNMIRLHENLLAFERLAAACRWLDTRIITLCTGTLDPNDMWKRHPGNASRAAWKSLVEILRVLLKVADRNEVTLAFEPEINNVVSSTARARMLLDEIASPWLKVVIDPANLMGPGDFPRLEEVLDEAFEWLGPDIVLAHAKNPVTGRDPGERITICDYLKFIQDRMPPLPEVQERRLSSVQERLKSAKAPEIVQAMKEFQAEEVSREAVDRQEFHFQYIRRLIGMEFGGALVMHGMSEEDVNPMQAMIAGLIQHLDKAVPRPKSD